MQKDPTPHAGGAAQARWLLLSDMAWHCTPCHTTPHQQSLSRVSPGSAEQPPRWWPSAEKKLEEAGATSFLLEISCSCRVWGLGLRVWGLGLRVRMLGLRVWDSGVLHVKKKVRVTELNRSGCQSNKRAVLPGPGFMAVGMLLAGCGFPGVGE